MRFSSPIHGVLLLITALIISSCGEARLPFLQRILPRIIRSKSIQRKSHEETMGNAVRMMKYDRAANVANAIPALSLNDVPLKWHRLDDGVMGGQSETLHSSTLEGRDGVHFAGRINTVGGGFTSIRAPLDQGLPDGVSGVRLRFRGDGKTYKLLLSDGSNSGPMGKTPSWQADLPTKVLSPSDVSQVTTLPLSSFLPSFGGRSALKEEDRANYILEATDMKELGLMLSLRLSDGKPNPKETFGEGEFEFSLFVESIETVLDKEKQAAGDEKEL